MNTHGGARRGAGRGGRLTDADEKRLTELLREGFPDAKVVAAIAVQVDLALKGDTKAFEVLMAYKYGKPKQSIDVTSDGQPLFKAYQGIDPDKV